MAFWTLESAFAACAVRMQTGASLAIGFAVQEIFQAGVADILANGRVDIGEPYEAGGQGVGAD
ncbi:hypothetical protein LB515_25710 [Mesorhizobium sp. CA15]|uniref:hypothetical protein n=1 Tax=Mesorhizobium sp. CA15 TaxID=2876641 RepID=UPI001CD0B3C3|nr:hypothetical protein [Mesorhizobium sp. CA15]MBZ9868784.1 hypothetical protein [Mesorhizobium sp. CA15]